MEVGGTLWGDWDGVVHSRRVWGGVVHCGVGVHLGFLSGMIHCRVFVVCSILWEVRVE